MSYSVRLLMDALSLHFLNIRLFEFEGPYHLHARSISPEVFWYVQEGGFTLTHRGRDYVCRPGDLVHLPLHSSMSWTADGGTIRYCSIRFRAEWEFPNPHSWSELLGLPTVVRSATGAFGPIVERIAHGYEQGAREYRLGNRLLLEGEFLGLVGTLLNDPQVSQSVTPLSSTALDTRIEAVVDFLVRHPGKMPEVGELERMTQLSASHLRALFRKHTGMPPVQFIHRVKANQARRMLETSDRPITEVARALGYDNLNYFSRVFKKLTGMVPHEYRRKSREV